MSYHSLSDSGMSADDMRAEAWRIIEMLRDEKGALGRLDAKQRDFVDKMARGYPVTTGQLFYLRDIKDKVL